jgi:hypothetical protein
MVDSIINGGDVVGVVIMVVAIKLLDFDDKLIAIVG